MNCDISSWCPLRAYHKESSIIRGKDTVKSASRKNKEILRTIAEEIPKGMQNILLKKSHKITTMNHCASLRHFLPGYGQKTSEIIRAFGIRIPEDCSLAPFGISVGKTHRIH